MKLEEAIGRKLGWLRQVNGLSQAQLGEALGRYLEKPWTRQAVNSAERGRRSFTARDLMALALVLETTVSNLLIPLGDTVEMPSGIELSKTELRKAIIHPKVGGSAAAEVSRQSLSQLHQLFGSYIQLHEKIGAELEFGMGMLAEAAKAIEEEPTDG